MVQGVPTIGGAPVFYPIAKSTIGFADREQLDGRVLPIASKSTIEFLDREQIDDRMGHGR